MLKKSSFHCHFQLLIHVVPQPIIQNLVIDHHAIWVGLRINKRNIKLRLQLLNDMADPFVIQLQNFLQDKLVLDKECVCLARIDAKFRR